MKTGLEKSLSKLKDEKGQNLVEFAFIMVLFLALFFGIMEFGRWWFRGNQLKHAANIAARTYAVTSGNFPAKKSAARLKVDEKVEAGMGSKVEFSTSETSVTATASEPFRPVICPSPPEPPPLGIIICGIIIERDATYRLEQ